jgi:hypothetical protein
MLQQLLIHGIGDYIFQSDYMAMNKSKKSIPCLIHILIYTSLFLFLTTSWKALLVIGGTHYLIDRYPIIIRRLIWLKNHINPKLQYVPFKYCGATGYYDDFTPSNVVINGYSQRFNYITIWLYIITDNLLHLTINFLALNYLT